MECRGLGVIGEYIRRVPTDMKQRFLYSLAACTPGKLLLTP